MELYHETSPTQRPILKLHRHTKVYRGKDLLGAISRASMEVKFTVNDLINGKKVECKDIMEMLELEEVIVSVSKTFKQVLEAVASFGGETVIEL